MQYIHEASEKTPKINFNLINGILEINGRSFPDDPPEFYMPLVEAIETYSNSAQPTTVVNVFIEYFNTSSSKCILDIFKKFENIHKSGSAVTINWNYKEDDEDMLEAGEHYQAMLALPFIITSIPSKR